MAHNDDLSMAVFCDFENIALGVRDAQYDRFEIKPVLERLLLKGSIVVKKAYCDWERYKSYKTALHEANFELIEIPHARQSGKNSADIRLVVDALDLCYTKPHVNTFVIISGDSDFSPLVSKLRENAKRVIGVGVKQSTSDLLIANCDEFIYIDDLVRKKAREDKQAKKPVDPQELEARKEKGLEIAASTLEALLEDRADDEKVWASVLKEAIKRRHPGFNETYHGFKTFGALLEEAARRGLLEFGREANSAYVRRRQPPLSAADSPTKPLPESQPAPTPAMRSEEAAASNADAAILHEPPPPGKARTRRRTRPRAQTSASAAAASLSTPREAREAAPHDAAAVQPEMPACAQDAAENREASEKDASSPPSGAERNPPSGAAEGNPAETGEKAPSSALAEAPRTPRRRRAQRSRKSEGAP
ncbi:MAG: NYN domain-containing protein [Rhodocyclaceae bacterium]|nr:NYN domain-containing protein [Rhodocyclaceae bacterium]